MDWHGLNCMGDMMCMCGNLVKVRASEVQVDRGRSGGQDGVFIRFHRMALRIPRGNSEWNLCERSCNVV